VELLFKKRLVEWGD